MGVRTIMFVPMIIAGCVTGLIAIRYAEKRAFRPEEIDLARALANQTMLAVQLTRLSAQSRQSAVIAERNRMAREIHDTLAHGLTGVIMHVEAAEEALSRNLLELVSSHHRAAGEIARDGLREARLSVRALRPSALEKGTLARALEELLEKATGWRRHPYYLCSAGRTKGNPAGMGGQYPPHGTGGIDQCTSSCSG